MLPFEGDATLSLILSKAMLLADDEAITIHDPAANQGEVTSTPSEGKRTLGTISSTRPVPEGYAPAIVSDVLARQQRGEAPKYVTYDGFPLYVDDPLHDSHMLLDAHLRAVGHGYEGYSRPRLQPRVAARFWRRPRRSGARTCARRCGGCCFDGRIA
jgi:hypothetical protein